MKYIGNVNWSDGPEFKLDIKGVNTEKLKTHLVKKLAEDPRSTEYRLEVLYSGAFFGILGTDLTIRFKSQRQADFVVLKEKIRALLEEVFPFQEIRYIS